MPRPLRTLCWSTIAITLLLPGCRGQDTAPATPASASVPAAGGLSPFQLEHGIGPVTEPITLAPVDEEMAERGEQQFTAKCSACHKMTERYVGPPLGDVTQRRSAAFIMNQVLAPDSMYARHPEVKRLLAEYMTQMPNMGLTREQAREVVEYLRTQEKDETGS